MVGLSTIHGVTLAIDLQDVTKTYRGGVQALRGVSLRVQSGEIFGLLGPNGAGKSTLVKIIMTVVRPTTLTGTVLGRPACTQEVLSQVGYLPEPAVPHRSAGGGLLWRTRQGPARRTQVAHRAAS